MRNQHLLVILTPFLLTTKAIFQSTISRSVSG